MTACPVESRGSADKDERVNEIGDAELGLEGPGMKDFSSAPVGDWRGMIAVEDAQRRNVLGVSRR